MFSFSSEANNLHSDRAVNLFDLIFRIKKKVCVNVSTAMLKLHFVATLFFVN